MAKNDINKPKVTKISKSLLNLNKKAGEIMDKMGSQNNSFDTLRNKDREAILQQANDLVDDALYDLKNKTGDDVSKFYYDLSVQETNLFQKDINNIETLFGIKSDQLYQIVDQGNRNRNVLYDRLGLIAEHLYELEEAVNTTRDAICAADEMSNRISRTLSFGNSSSDESHKQKAINDIEVGIEEKYNLLHKIRSFITPRTVTLGEYRAITIPHQYIFSENAKKKANAFFMFNNSKKRGRRNQNTPSGHIGNINSNVVREMSDYVVYDSTSISGEVSTLLEHISITDDKDMMTIMETINNNNPNSSDKINNIKKELSDVGVDIIIDDDLSPILVESINGIEGDSNSLSDMDFNRFAKSVMKNSNNLSKGNIGLFTDGVVNAKIEKFDDIKGCYFKLVDPRRLFPIEGIDGEPLGYIYIHTPISDECNPAGKQQVTNMFNRLNLTDQKGDKNQFIARMVDKIYKAFNKKFLLDHIKFKDTIAQALLYNDYYSKNITFQYVPLEYVTTFKIDEDLDGRGTSMLKRSLFKAHMYLGLFLFKYMSIVDRSNDVRIFYVKSSIADKRTARRTESMLRNMAEKTPSYAELSSYVGMMKHVNVANRDIVAPVGPNDVKAVDMDVLQGQDIQMQNDFLEGMRTDYINATGVPSVIMNYVNEADYAKTLVMANSKFRDRVVNYQMDLADGITELYKKLIRYNGLDIPEELLNRFQFKFNQPKMLNFNNMSDLISNAEQTLNFAVKVLTGENSDQSNEANIDKDKLFAGLAQDLLPMIPWSKYKKIYDESRLDTKKQVLQNKEDEDNQ